MEERFILTDLPDSTWSVSWPGYEWVLCNNELKATTLLKILFDEVEVEDAVLAVKNEESSNDEFVTTIPKYTWWKDPDGASKFLVRRYAVVGCKFETLESAEQFKTIMEKRLAWTRLSGKGWS